VLVFKGREPANVLGSREGAFSTEVLQHGVHVDRVPQDDDVDDEPEGAELVFLAFPVFLPNLPTLAVENCAGQRMAPLLAVELSEDSPAVVLIINVGKEIKRFGEPAKLPDSARKGRGPVASKERTGGGCQEGAASLMVKNCTLRAPLDDLLAGAEGPQLPAPDAGILGPVVVAGQVDVVPLERR